MTESEGNGYLETMLFFFFLTHDDNQLISSFRFLTTILLELCSELGPALVRDMVRSHTLPVPLQVLTTLGCLTTGAFWRELADLSGLSVILAWCHASCMGWDNPYASHVYKVPI